MYVHIFQILADAVTFEPITESIMLLVIAIAIRFFYRLAGAKK